MASIASRRVPAWYWAVAGAAGVWALIGCWSYLMQVTMGPAEWTRLPAEQQAVWRETPRWVMGIFAVAVWSGLAGAAGLLLRRAWARHAFLVSAVAVAAQFTAAAVVTPLLSLMGPQALAFPAFIFAAAAAQHLFARWATRRGWLR